MTSLPVAAHQFDQAWILDVSIHIANKAALFGELARVVHGDGLLVLHRGRVVYERYHIGLQPHQPHVLWSMSKSLVGLLATELIQEGAIDPEQFRMDAMFDRMDAVGKAMLGLTIQCSQCHNHKYDPISQEEYYRMFAFLNNDHEANVAVYTPEEEQRRGEVFRRLREIDAEIQHRYPDWEERQARWEEEVKRDQPEWTVIQPEVDEISNGGQKYLPLADGSFLAGGYAPTKHTVKMTIQTKLESIAELSGRINEATAAGQDAADLKDKRDALLLELTKKIEVRAYTDGNGQLVVQGPGVTLVQGSKLRQLSLDIADDGSLHVFARTNSGGQGGDVADR